MRLAVCALSAVLLSGCSWLGGGSHHDDSYGYQYGYGGAYGAGGQAGCMPGYGYGGYGQAGGAGGCAPGAGYSVAQNGYMGAGAGGMYGAGGAGGMYGNGGAGGMYGAGGAGGMYGAGGMAGAGMYGASGMAGTGMYGMGSGAYGSTTTLSSAAPYGTAVGGGVTSGGVQTVQGSPIYVAQPYPSYYGVPVLRGYSQGGGYGYGGGYSYGSGYGGAMPFGIELGGGSEFDIGGDIFTGKAASPNNEDFALATGQVVSPAISYDQAFKQGYNVGGGLSYDVGPSTTVLGMVNYQKNSGNTFDNGTFQPGTYDALGNFTATGAAETVTAELTDLEQVTLEGGVRQYMGGNGGFRPYVGAMGGFTHNNAVDLTQSSTTLGTFTQNYIESGWTPTAAGLVGAEMAVGPRAAIGVETGIRWRDSLDTNVTSDDRWSIPVSLRGRVAF